MALAIEAVVLGALLTVALDMYAHNRVEALGGVNIWGYRGAVMRVRQPNEIRIAVVGGGLAFGWGVAASETLAPTIRQLVSMETDKPGAMLRPVTAINLGALGLPPSRYAARIEHYGYLQPDVICIVADADRATWSEAWLPDMRSAVWQQTGYALTLPLVLEEKRWRRTAAAIRSVDAALARTEPPANEEYAEALAAAATRALDSDAAVLLVLPPRTSAHDETDRAAVARVVQRRLAVERRFRFIDLAGEIGQIDEGLQLDGTNMSTAGHFKVATHVAPAVVDLVLERPPS